MSKGLLINYVTQLRGRGECSAMAMGIEQAWYRGFTEGRDGVKYYSKWHYIIQEWPKRFLFSLKTMEKTY